MITEHDLAHGLADALAYGMFSQTRRNQLESLLTRWAIEHDPPSAGRALQRQLAQDYPGALHDLLRLHADDQMLLADAYTAYYEQSGGARPRSAERQLEAWKASAARLAAAEAQQCAANRGNRGLDHGSSTTMRA